MEKVKEFAICLVVVCFFLQSGSIFISGDKYKKIYNLICATIIISLVLKIPVRNFDLSLQIPESDVNVFEFDLDKVKKEFLDETESRIKKDVYEKFGVELYVDASTDFGNIKFNIHANAPESTIGEISKYIRNNYCTDNDEVYISNEYH